MIPTAALTTVTSALAALVAIVVTNFFARRREQEADWRKLKLEQYQKLIHAFSGIEKSRQTQESTREFTDAVNAMALVGSPLVLKALKLYLDANAFNNPARNEKEINRLFSLLIHTLRADIQPRDHQLLDPSFQFALLSLPPENAPNRGSEK
jgi:Zn-dependent protease with chaperone function